MDRIHRAPFVECRNCAHAQAKHNQAAGQDSLAWYLGILRDKDGKIVDLSMDTRIHQVLRLRKQCYSYHTEIFVERDTTYPGVTNAPWDHPAHLKIDSTDLDFRVDLHEPKCQGFSAMPKRPAYKYNAWEKEFLPLCLDRNRKVRFPADTEVIRILEQTEFPHYGFYIHPAEKHLGRERGLWFQKGRKIDFELDRNAEVKREVRRYIMWYMYHVWFDQNILVEGELAKRLAKMTDAQKAAYLVSIRDDRKEALLWMLSGCTRGSWGYDLCWWIKNPFCFNNPSLQALCKKVTFLTPKGDQIMPEDADEVEVIPFSQLSYIEKAQLAAEAELGDIELEYEEILNEHGLTLNEETDKIEQLLY
jgi:hypothetical protein